MRSHDDCFFHCGRQGQASRELLHCALVRQANGVWWENGMLSGLDGRRVELKALSDASQGTPHET